MTAPFDGPRLKIARARRHVTELGEMVEAYWSRRPIRIVVERLPTDPDQFKWWRVRISEMPPADLSPEIGDVLHNLRSALDVMSCDLVKRRGKSDKGVYFPFANSKTELGEIIKRRNFDRAGQEAVKLLKELQPYRGGNEGLRALHDLNIQDKHQMIVPAALASKLDLSHLMPDANEEALEQLRNWTGRIIDGQVVVGLASDAGPPFGTIIDAQYWLLLFYPETGAGHEVVHFMNELCRVVENINELFAKTKV